VPFDIVSRSSRLILKEECRRLQASVGWIDRDEQVCGANLFSFSPGRAPPTHYFASACLPDLGRCPWTVACQRNCRTPDCTQFYFSLWRASEKVFQAALEFDASLLLESCNARNGQNGAHATFFTNAARLLCTLAASAITESAPDLRKIRFFMPKRSRR